MSTTLEDMKKRKIYRANVSFKGPVDNYRKSTSQLVAADDIIGAVEALQAHYDGSDLMISNLSYKGTLDIIAPPPKP